MNFSLKTQLTALAIVRIFETSQPKGEFGAYAVLDDGAGVSYGIFQFTHRSGSLLAVVERYLALGGAVGAGVFRGLLPMLVRRDAVTIKVLAANSVFEKALKAAAATREMRAAQSAIAAERYLSPAIDACDDLGLVLPLSFAVVCDSIVHGSWTVMSKRVVFASPAEAGDERQWITAYVRARHAWLLSSPRLKKSAYRTRFFLEQIMRGRWQLELPFAVNGFLLRETDLAALDRSTISAAEPAVASANDSASPAAPPSAEIPSESSATGRDDASSRPDAQPPKPDATPTVREILMRAEREISHALRRYDRVESVVATAAARTDAAKSLWTAVLGTLWQGAWALIGFASGVHGEIWLAAAIISGVLAAAYLYRQIALGKIRERSASVK